MSKHHDAVWSEGAKNFKYGIYRHFKGDEFKVVCIAHHSEDRELELVIYHPVDAPERIWARPLAMWLEEVDRPEYGYKGPRFTWLRED